MGEGEPREEVCAASRRGQGGGGWGERSTLRVGRAGGGREDTQEAGAGASASASARGQREEGGTRRTLVGGGTGEPPSSPSRPERETPEMVADWLTKAQVVGARRQCSFSSPPP